MHTLPLSRNSESISSALYPDEGADHGSGLNARRTLEVSVGLVIHLIADSTCDIVLKRQILGISRESVEVCMG